MIRTSEQRGKIYGRTAWIAEHKNDAGEVWHRIGYVRTDRGYVGVHASWLIDGRQELTFETIRFGTVVYRHESRRGLHVLTKTGVLRVALRWGREVLHAW